MEGANLANNAELPARTESVRPCVRVAAAVILREGTLPCEILATQRGYGEYKDWWEFPGGKIKEGEAPAQACAREIREELGVELTDIRLLMTVEYDYPTFHLSMDCFTCRVAPGQRICLLEHEAMRWLGINELREVRWLPADVEVVERMMRYVP